jgi:acetate kinase
VRVLAVNAGSSSLKLALVEDEQVVAQTNVERWEGEGHLQPIHEFLDDAGQVDAVGHRVVHGGPDFDQAVLVDEDVLATLGTLADLAPLHNPRAVAAIREVSRLLPDVPAVACFDTTFHRTIPPAAHTYALPREWNQRWRLRRYGFHGLSHAYVVRRAADVVGADLEDLRVVSCHLGAGGSLCAVRSGASVDTTMGFTPLAGLVMATRSGSLDPGLVLWLLQHGGIDEDHLGDVLEHGSGLKGLSGTSGDLREVLAARAEGDQDASLAFDVFMHRLVREAGAMVASAGGLDLLVVTGGVGQHSPDVRSGLAAGLQHLGVEVDPRRNADADGDVDITAEGARVSTVVVATSEETQVARETSAVVQRSH